MISIKWMPGIGLLMLVSACASPDQSRDQAARLTAPGGEVLQQAVEAAMGVPVMLADDTLLNSSQLIIERRQRRQLDQGLLMGTDLTGPVEQFTLVRNGEECLLIKRSDKSRWPLRSLHCVAE